MSLRESTKRKVAPNLPDNITTNKTKTANVGLRRSEWMDSMDSGLGPSRGPSRSPSMVSMNDPLSAELENLKLDSSSNSSSVTTVKTAYENKTSRKAITDPIIDDSKSEYVTNEHLDSGPGSRQTRLPTMNQVKSKKRPMSLSLVRSPEEPTPPYLEITNDHHEPQINQHPTIENDLEPNPVSPGSPPVGSTEYCHLIYDQNWELGQHWNNNMEPVDPNGNPVNNVTDYLVDQPDYVENYQEQYNDENNDAGL